MTARNRNVGLHRTERLISTSSTPRTPPTSEDITYHRHIIKNVVNFDSLSSEQQKVFAKNYYTSYDVNDGIRTATALGGLTTLFVVFLIYKTKCKSKNDYLSVSENLPLEDFPSKDGRTSQDVSNIFSNSSSVKGSNLLLNPPEGFQSPIFMHSSRAQHYSQSSYDGVVGSAGAQVDYYDGSSSAGFSGSTYREGQFRIMSPTDGVTWTRNEEGRRLKTSRGLYQNPTMVMQEANINIQVIQPTPNITPRGSLRIDSLDSLKGNDEQDIRVIIPLLTPLRTSRPSSQSQRRKSESPFASGFQHRVSFDEQSVGSDNVFVEDDNYDVPAARRKHEAKSTGSHTTKSSKKKQKSNQETTC